MADCVNITPGFCPNCGSILPQLKLSGSVICYQCEKNYNPSVFGSMKVEYKIHFNTYDKSTKAKDDSEQDEGPVVDRICPKCYNDKMSYATLQLRSADEGQTVFFTCTKCHHKESENS